MKAWPCGCCQFASDGFIVCPEHQVVVGGMTVVIPGGLSQDELDALTRMHEGSAVLTRIARTGIARAHLEESRRLGKQSKKRIDKLAKKLDV